jgi:tetratricopeptide (TPR) repeat protein
MQHLRRDSSNVGSKQYLDSLYPLARLFEFGPFFPRGKYVRRPVYSWCHFQIGLGFETLIGGKVYMNAAIRRRAPANDFGQSATQKLSYVVLRRPSHGKRIAAGAVLGLFVLLLVVSGFSSPVTPPKAIEVKVPVSDEPFDIVINGPGGEDADLDLDFEQQVLEEAGKHLAPAVHVDIEGGGTDERDAVGKETLADRQATAAQNYMRLNDLKKAIRAQRKAVQLDPLNMSYRLQLAIMHDRLSDRKGALELYRQVLRAYDGRDITLPLDFDAEGVRERLTYLATAQ